MICQLQQAKTLFNKILMIEQIQEEKIFNVFQVATKINFFYQLQKNKMKKLLQTLKKLLKGKKFKQHCAYVNGLWIPNEKKYQQNQKFFLAELQKCEKYKHQLSQILQILGSCQLQKTIQLMKKNQNNNILQLDEQHQNDNTLQLDEQHQNDNAQTQQINEIKNKYQNFVKKIQDTTIPNESIYNKKQKRHCWGNIRIENLYNLNLPSIKGISQRSKTIDYSQLPVKIQQKKEQDQKYQISLNKIGYFCCQKFVQTYQKLSQKDVKDIKNNQQIISLSHRLFFIILINSHTICNVTLNHQNNQTKCFINYDLNKTKKKQKSGIVVQTFFKFMSTLPQHHTCQQRQNQKCMLNVVKQQLGKLKLQWNKETQKKQKDLRKQVANFLIDTYQCCDLKNKQNTKKRSEDTYLVNQQKQSKKQKKEKKKQEKKKQKQKQNQGVQPVDSKKEQTKKGAIYQEKSQNSQFQEQKNLFLSKSHSQSNPLWPESSFHNNSDSYFFHLGSQFDNNE